MGPVDGVEAVATVLGIGPDVVLQVGVLIIHARVHHGHDRSAAAAGALLPGQVTGDISSGFAALLAGVVESPQARIQIFGSLRRFLENVVGGRISHTFVLTHQGDAFSG